MITRLKPGFVHIKNAINIDEQRTVVQIANQLSNYNKFLISTKSRLRIYDCLHNFPQYEFLTSLTIKALEQAHMVDNTISKVIPTHLIFLKYTDSTGIKYHMDDSENDGEELHPVVSISIGNSCDFGIKWDETEKNIRLDSGDIVIFGGDSRFILHSVKNVHKNTAPAELDFNYRLNLTFRYTPKMIGREHEFTSYTLQDYLRLHPNKPIL